MTKYKPKHKLLKYPIKKCKWCGKQFIAKKCNLYCSEECRKDKRSEYLRRLNDANNVLKKREW